MSPTIVGSAVATTLHTEGLDIGSVLGVIEPEASKILVIVCSVLLLLLVMVTGCETSAPAEYEEAASHGADWPTRGDSDWVIVCGAVLIPWPMSIAVVVPGIGEATTVWLSRALIAPV